MVGISEVPVASSAADLCNAGISFGRGDKVGGGLSLCAAIPIVGAGANAARLGRTVARGLGNIGGGATTASKALSHAERWLGAGYKEISPGVFRSADNTRQFRMTTSDLLDPKQGSHVHFETIGANGRTITENSHVGIRP